MNKSKILMKYALVQDRAKTPQEKKDRISYLKGLLNNRQAIASNSQNSDAERRFNKQKDRLDRFGAAIGFKKFEVFVNGRFKYHAVVNASNEADAERIAKNEVAHAAPALELSQVTTNKPIHLRN